MRPQTSRLSPRLSIIPLKEGGWTKKIRSRTKAKHSQSENEEAIAKDHDKDPTDDVPDILTRRMRRLRKKRMQDFVGFAQQLGEAVTPPSLHCYESSYHHSYINSRLQRKNSLIYATAVEPGDVNNAKKDD